MNTHTEQALELAGETHAGMVRTHNEDAIRLVPDLGLLVLADGMGGYNAGEVASGIAVTLVEQEVRNALASASPAQAGEHGLSRGFDQLGHAIRQANATIYQTAQSQPQCAGMGTTLVAALFYDNRMLVAHVGDSRLYRLRGDAFTLLTRDHSLLQEQLDSGLITPEEAVYSQNRNLVTRAVGIDVVVEPELREYAVEVGDLYLLCSDGLNDMVAEGDIADVLTAMGGNLPLAAGQLVQLANDQGGRDNVSVILVRVTQAFADPGPWWSRWRRWLLGN
jgi:serine/threonine protein phosphatase PrpC